MIPNIPLITDLLQLHERRQIIIDERLRRANLHCRTFDYQPGDQIKCQMTMTDSILLITKVIWHSNTY